MVKFDEVTKTYSGSDRGVFSLSFELSPGITGFLGRNGSGKTTTMRLLTGLLMPDNGRVFIDGRNFWQQDNLVELKRLIGFLPNEDYFFHRLTGRENLEYLSLLKTRKRSAYRRVDGIMRRLEITDALDRPFGDYSSGMRKKVQIVGALIGDPEIVVLDEPFSGLDVMSNIVLNQLIRSLRSQDKVVFVSSHLAGVFDDLADRLVIIEEGEVARELSAPLDRPVVDLYVQTVEDVQSNNRVAQ